MRFGHFSGCGWHRRERVDHMAVGKVLPLGVVDGFSCA